MPKTFWLGHYQHKHGDDYELHASHEGAVKMQAAIAREWWADRHDQLAPDDHEGLSNQEVIDAYFGTDGGFNESYAIVQVTEPEPDTVTKALEHVRAVHPEVTSVVFTAGQSWIFMDDMGQAPAFTSQIDVDLLNDALNVAHEQKGLPCVYRLDVPVNV